MGMGGEGNEFSPEFPSCTWDAVWRESGMSGITATSTRLCTFHIWLGRHEAGRNEKASEVQRGKSTVVLPK